MSETRQVQCSCPWEPCGRAAVATWFWGGGPSLAMCSVHDEEMKQHAKDCKACRGLERKQEEPNP